MALTQAQMNTIVQDLNAMYGGDGFGMRKYNALLDMGADTRQIAEIALQSPIIGPAAQQMFRDDAQAIINSGSGIGLGVVNKLKAGGYDSEQILQALDKAPSYGPALQADILANPTKYFPGEGIGGRAYDIFTKAGATQDQLASIGAQYQTGPKFNERFLANFKNEDLGLAEIAQLKKSGASQEDVLQKLASAPSYSQDLSESLLSSTDEYFPGAIGGRAYDILDKAGATQDQLSSIGGQLGTGEKFNEKFLENFNPYEDLSLAEITQLKNSGVSQEDILQKLALAPSYSQDLSENLLADVAGYFPGSKEAGGEGIGGRAYDILSRAGATQDQLTDIGLAAGVGPKFTENYLSNIDVSAPAATAEELSALGATEAQINDILTGNKPITTIGSTGIKPYQTAVYGLSAIPLQERFLPSAGRATLATQAPVVEQTLRGPTSLIQAPPASEAVTEAVTEARSGGMINYADGGDVEYAGSRALSASDLGSTFDIANYVDDQGRLVGGYSRPVTEDGVVVGYEFVPYAERAVAEPDIYQQVRQGLTGISPTTGGLPGIIAREAVMRSRPKRYGYAEGGLASAAKQVAAEGRNGDTMLAHVTPKEAGILKALGGSGTINPKTGLPEYFSLFPKGGISLNFGPLGKVKIGKKSSDLIQAAAAIATGNYFQMPLATTAAAYGGVRAAATGSLEEGIRGGLTAYGMGSAYNAYNAAPGATPGGAGGGTGSMSAGPAGVGVGVDTAGQVTSQNVALTGPDMGFEIANAPGAGFELPAGKNAFTYGAEGEFVPVGSTAPLPGPEVVTPSPSGVTYGKLTLPAVTDMTAPAAATAPDGFLARNLPPGVQEYLPKFLLDASGTELTAGTILGGSLISGQVEREKAKKQAAILAAQNEEKKRKYRELFARTLGQVPTNARSGGLMSLAGGGVAYMEAGGTTGPTGTPRDVVGTGDGMSDSVPADIEGVQEARLADGEFVIPADVVSDIGNGSSDAGSQKLYAMMDRIREARHGTTKQPPEINAESMMPV